VPPQPGSLSVGPEQLEPPDEPPLLEPPELLGELELLDPLEPLDPLELLDPLEPLLACAMLSVVSAGAA
jgi:hypothetical protein